MSERVTDATTLKPGDVVTVAVELPDKQRRGQTFWWTRFGCVLRECWYGDCVDIVTLKMHIDEQKDIRMVDVTRDVVMKLEEHEWPQGVLAMRMKHLLNGNISLDGKGKLGDGTAF